MPTTGSWFIATISLFVRICRVSLVTVGSYAVEIYVSVDMLSIDTYIRALGVRGVRHCDRDRGRRRVLTMSKGDFIKLQAVK